MIERERESRKECILVGKTIEQTSKYENIHGIHILLENSFLVGLSEVYYEDVWRVGGGGQFISFYHHYKVLRRRVHSFR